MAHQHTRRRERQMQRIKSAEQAQRFLGLHARVGNLFPYGPHLISKSHHTIDTFVSEHSLFDHWSRTPEIQ